MVCKMLVMVAISVLLMLVMMVLASVVVGIEVSHDGGAGDDAGVSFNDGGGVSCDVSPGSGVGESS